VIVEIINTGNELMLGRVLNTHQQWLCRQLADRGYVVSRQIAVADTASEIETAVGEALSRADLVITTGGLGPTSDDLTRDAIARMLGTAMREDASVLANIEQFFTKRNRPMPASTYVEAQVPVGAVVLPNHFGTAPGLALKVEPGKFRNREKQNWLIMLPGPPRELRPMFLEFAMPLILRELPFTRNFVCRTFRTNGVGESSVQEKIYASLQSLVDAGLDVGYCARPWQVDIRLVATGVRSEELVKSASRLVYEQLGANIYGVEDELMEEVIVRLLVRANKTLALAESCTGGSIANRITNVPGASSVFKGGFVTYSNELKHLSLGVGLETLKEHGAVSEPVAREMADGARRVVNSDYAIAVTGIAGPSGGTVEKPVGTVFIAVATPSETKVWKMLNPWDRVTFKEVSAQQALNFLRLSLETSSAQPV
jgi:nicotinamide-nucleotide amidase